LELGSKAEELSREKGIVAKSKKVKTGWKLEKLSKEGYGSERAILPLMMMIRSRSIKWETYVA
jgi:hypothetical protein